MEHTTGHDDGRGDLRGMIGRAANVAWATMLRSAGAMVAITVIFIGVAILAMGLLSELARIQRNTILDEGRVTFRGVMLLVVEVGAPVLLIAFLLMVTAMVATLTLAADHLDGRRSTVANALARGFRRAPSVLATMLLFTLGVGVAFVAAPALFVIGVLGLLLTPPVRLASSKWSLLERWPAPRGLFLLAVPFALAVTLAARWSLALPAAGIERRTGRQALARSRDLVRGRAVLVVALLLLSIAAANGTQLLFGFLLHRFDGHAAINLLGVATQLLVAGVPMVMAVVVFRQLAGPTDPEWAVPIPEPRVPASTLATSILLVVAIAAGTMAITATWRAQPAAAAEAVTFTVDSVEDGPDALPGDGGCRTAAGVCTLRAAIDEISASPLDHVRIDMAVSGTIALSSPLEVTTSLDLDAAGQHLVITGRSCETCAPASGLFRFMTPDTTIALANVTFDGGLAGPDGGGAIVSVAEVALKNVTFVGNVSSTAPGGAIAVLGGYLGVENGTFVDDVAPAGADIAVMGGEINVLQSTFVGGSSSALLRANDGQGAIYSNIIDSQGPVVCEGSDNGRLNGGFNFAREGQCDADQPATNLGSLSDNGGWVPTVALLEGSSAIDRGNPEGCGPTDARGVARPQGNRCDIGAFEYKAPVGPTFVIDDLGDRGDAALEDGSCLTDDGTCTLRAAVEQINALTGLPSHIEAGVDGTIVLGSPITLTAPMTISGNGRTVTISGGGQTSLFNASEPDIEIVLDRLTLADGYTDDPEGGAALRSVAELDAQAVTFTGNVAANGPGGAAVVSGGTTSFTNATFWDNEATAGADVWIRSTGYAFLTASTLANGSSGSVLNEGGGVTLYNDIVAPAAGPACVGTSVGLRNISSDESCNDSLRDAEAGLGTLALRGGTVPTVNLTSTSSAIDGVGSASWYCPATDARGIRRPQGEWCDIGSYERSDRPDATVALAVDPAAPTVGQVIRATATVSSFDPSWEPIGTVTFSADDVEVGTAAVTADGTATVEITSLLTGDHALRASYEATDELGPGRADVAIAVGRATTTVSLAAGPNPSVAGGAVALKAAVHVVAPGPGPATGTVRFLADGTEIGSASLDADGMAALSTTALAVGSRSLTATYDGDDQRTGSTAPAVAQVVGSAGADVAVISSAPTTRYGQAVTFTAKVTPKAPGAVATGGVVFTVDGNPLAAASLDGTGTASATVDTWDVGTYTVVATYDGDGQVGPGVSPMVTHSVNSADTTVQLMADHPSTVNGDDVTFTATVTAVAPGGGIPTGTVVFYDESIEIARVDGTGSFALTRNDLTSGNHLLTATYEGSSKHLSATSAELDHVVTLRPATAKISLGDGPFVYGSEIEVTVTVTAADGSIPHGPVLVAIDGGGFWTQLDPTTGRATASILPPSSGPATITAFYWGDGIYTDANAPDVHVDVAEAPTVVQLDAPATSTRGMGAQLTATVTVPGQTTAPVGNITFLNDGNVLATVPVDGGGRAQFEARGLTTGPHELTAQFAGPQFASSVSPPVPHQVLPASTATVVAGPTRGTVIGQEATFTATVTATGGAGTPTGTVVWSEDGTELGRTTVAADGSAVFATRRLGRGTHDLTATFSGDVDHGPSLAHVQHRVAQATTTVALTADVGRPVTGQTVTYTAQVTVTDPGVAMPSGTVTFLGLSSVAVPVDVDGRAHLTVAVPVGRPFVQQFTARYSGDTDLEGSDGQLSQMIDPASTTVAITADATTVPMGTDVTIHVDVAVAAPGGGRPTDGTVIIRHAGREIDRFSANGLPATRQYETPDVLAVGNYGLTAELTGATGFRDATSASLSVLVAPLVPTVTVSSAATPTVAGRPLTIEVQVTGGPLRLSPTGTIRLFEGSQTLASGPVTWLGSAWGAKLSVNGLNVGEHRLVATYETSSSNYRSTESAPLVQVIDPTPTSVVFADPPIVRSGGTARWLVFVRNVDGTSITPARPTGSVAFTLDGEPIGSRMVVSDTVPGWSEVTMVSPPLERGIHRVTASYVPTGNFGPSQATIDQPVETVKGTVELTPFKWSPTWGEAVYFTAKVVPPAGLTLTPPTGTVTIDAGAGRTCTVSAVGGSCSLQWADPGQKSVKAHYGGDAVYQAISSPSVNLTVAKRQPTLDASVSSASPQTGAPVTMSWQLTGPDDGVVSSVLGWSSACPSTLVGQCTATPSLNEAGSKTYRAAVDYAGDARWSPTRWSATVVPVGCFPLRLGVDGPGGTLTAATKPNCGNGTGYLENTRVTVTATPDVSGDPGFDWYFSKAFPAPAGDPTQPLDRMQTVTVGRGLGQTELVIAQFDKRFNCATVYIGTERTNGAQGAFYPVGNPNCPTDAAGKATFSEWTFVDGMQVGRMILGTKVATKVDAFGEAQFYGVRRGRSEPITQPSTPGVAPTIEVTGDVWLKAVLGPRCYTVGASVDGPGTATIESRMNCNDPRGTMGWTLDSDVVVVAQPNADNQFVDHWGPGYSGERSTATLVCAGCGDRGADRFTYRYTVPAGPTGSAAVPHRPVVATIKACWSIDVQRQYAAGPTSESAGLGKVVMNEPNCPVHSTGSWYADGTQIGATATPEYDMRFGKWNDDQDHGREDHPFNAYRMFRITADTVMRPSFYRSSECHRVEIVSQDPAWVQVSTEGAAGDPVCPHGNLSANWYRPPVPPGLDDGPADAVSGLRVADKPFQINAHVTQGDPLVGWVVNGPIPPRGRGAAVVGTTANVSMESDVAATASVCVGVEPQVRFIDPQGRSKTVDFDGGDFIGVWPPPDCPFTDNAWKVGTTVELAALADPRGYTFQGWSEGSEAEGFSTTVELDGSAPYVPVTVSYQVVCHQLTLTHDAKDVTAYPEPDCPGADPAEMRYVGGTMVLLSGRVPKGKVWQGWVGDVVAPGKVEPARVLMDADKTAGHRWRSKDTGEKIEDALEVVFEPLAIVAKKALGVVALVLVEVMTSYPPLDIIVGVSSLFMGLELILDAMGVPDSITDYLAHVYKTINLITAGLTCLATWSFSNGGDDGAAQLGFGVGYAAHDDAVNGAKDARESLEDLNKLESSRTFISTGGHAVEETTDAITKAKIGYAKLSPKVGRASAAVGVAMGALDAAQNGSGIGWDGSAKEAWTSWGSYEDCMLNSMPGYTGLTSETGWSGSGGGSSKVPQSIYGLGAGE